jgi:Glycosyltransferase
VSTCKVFLLRNNKQLDGGYKNFLNIRNSLGVKISPVLVESTSISSYKVFIALAIKNPTSKYIINQAFLCLLVCLFSLGRAKIAYIIDSIDNNYPASKLAWLKSCFIKWVNRFLFSRKRIFVISETKYLANLVSSFKVRNEVAVLNTPFPMQDHGNVCSYGDPVRLLYVGRMSQEKGVENLLDFALYAKAKGLNYKFDLIGDGDLKDIFNIAALDNVELHGWKSADEVALEYQKGGIFLHLPIKDAYPTSIREAMSYAMPVISLKQQGIPELVTSKVNGLLLDVYQPIFIEEAVSEIIRKYGEFSSSALNAAAQNDVVAYGYNLNNILTLSGILGNKS